MIPALPAASYLEEGLVMSSIFSMEDAGTLLRYCMRSVPAKGLGLPSIMMITPCFPRSLMPLSSLTTTPGDRSNKLSTWLPAEDILFSTLMMMRSSFL